jgi:putative transcriptional regulator
MTIMPEKRDEIMQAIDWDRQRSMTDEEIEQSIADDPDASPMTDADGMALRIQMIRKGIGLSQPKFAERYEIPLATLRDWEQARRQPDAAAWAYIRVIEAQPQIVADALRTKAA